jgi:hypothetical protein
MPDQAEVSLATASHTLQPIKAPRFAACDILHRAEIPACIWLEDALDELGVPTLVFELFLLVHDVDSAGQVLLEAGYQRSTPSLALQDIPQFSTVFRPAQQEFKASTQGAQSLDETSGSVILLPAAEWFYALPPWSEDTARRFPTLPHLLSSLIAVWLQLDEIEVSLRLRIAVYLGYIYEYLDAVKSSGFEHQLPREYWVFHFDQLQDINTADLGTFRCQQHYQLKTRSISM